MAVALSLSGPCVIPMAVCSGYSAERVIGSGSFGVVYKAVQLTSQQTVAIKKVREDRRYKNRELQIMKAVKHPNIVTLMDCF